MLLVLKTVVRRIALPLVFFLIWTPVASAWSWPVQGQVLRPFSYDESNPYAAGQHRGIDIGAGGAGETVVAPATGTVTFAGTVPTNGQSVTIGTADGYSVTLTHLGSIVVHKGEPVAERDPIGTIGPSGVPELAGPYVHLGIRVTDDPNGYVDPLGLLPPAPASGGTDSGSTESQPTSSGATSTEPASEPTPPVPATPTVATARGSRTAHARSRASAREHERAQERRPTAQPSRPSHRPAARDVRVPPETATPMRRASRPASFSRRPVVETAAPAEPAALDAGYEIRQGSPVAPIAPRRQPSSDLFALSLNGGAALVALGAALPAGRRRRRPRAAGQLVGAQVLEFLPSTPPRPTRRAA